VDGAGKATSCDQATPPPMSLVVAVALATLLVTIAMLV
jgi:hypothetical protein